MGALYEIVLSNYDDDTTLETLTGDVSTYMKEGSQFKARSAVGAAYGDLSAQIMRTGDAAARLQQTMKELLDLIRENVSDGEDAGALSDISDASTVTLGRDRPWDDQGKGKGRAV